MDFFQFINHSPNNLWGEKMVLIIIELMLVLTKLAIAIINLNILIKKNKK